MKKVYVILLLILICLSLGLFYANIKSPVKIAIIGKFEEERYEFVTSSVIAGRVVENDINNAQGIRGREIEVVVKDDDFSNPEATIKYLLKNKIEAIVTTATSEEILKIKPYLDKNKIVCMSVGATSSTLNNQNDYIYRILPDDVREIDTLFQYLKDSNLSREFAIIYSDSNKKYKESIKDNIIKLNGKVSIEESFDGDSISYTPSNGIASSNRTILVLASARDTAILVQKLNKAGINKNIFGLSWSGDKNLIYYGGKPVENFKFVSPVPLSSDALGYGELSKKLQLYKKDNGLIPYGVYEAFLILQKGYEQKYEKHLTLKEAIDKTGTFDSIFGNFVFNKFGDTNNNEYIFTVRATQFVKIGGSSYEDKEN